MSWYKTVLSSQQVVAGELIALVDDFEHAYRDLGQPKGMALFQGKTVPAGITVYFSPGTVVPASYLIAAYAGTECERPNKHTLGFLSGDENVLDSLE